MYHDTANLIIAAKAQVYSLIDFNFDCSNIILRQRQHYNLKKRRVINLVEQRSGA